MTDLEAPFLIRLHTLLGDRCKDTIYPCIRDLVSHGLDRSRFAAGEVTPQRQDITQYVAAWCRQAGLGEEEARVWLVDYCDAMLAVLSKSGPSAIRHSTKSNLRYIYRSAVPFLCGCADNRFRAHCSTDCPVYADMQAKLQAAAIEALKPKPLFTPSVQVLEPRVSVKETHREQFQTALRLAQAEIQKGTKLPRIVAILNERGLKTRTGKPWRYGTLRNELEDSKNSTAPGPDSGPSTGPAECPEA